MNLAGFNSVGLVTHIPEMSPKTNIAETVTFNTVYFWSYGTKVFLSVPTIISFNLNDLAVNKALDLFWNHGIFTVAAEISNRHFGHFHLK